MKFYMVYDGRAVYDRDSASVLYCIGKAKKGAAVREFKREYAEMDAVLFEFDEEEAILTNAKIVEC